MADRIVLHVDMDSFFAACEERERQELKGKPVVVCVYSGRGNAGGAVSTANYEARELGVHSGMPIAIAKRTCPDGVFLPVNHELYSRISDEIMSILRSHTTALEQVSVDEAFLDITTKTKDFGEAGKVALATKTEIRERLGLTCSIGIGPNKLIAKMASDIEKPDGLMVVEPQRVKDFLVPLKPRKLWGVGEKTAEKLAEMGIRSIGELAVQDEGLLRRVFGEAKGRWLKQTSRGIDNEPVAERGEPEQVGRMMTLSEDTRDRENILEALNPLIDDVYRRLTERGDYFRTITITAVTSDLKSHTRSRTIETPTRSLDVMKQLVDELTSSFLKENKGMLLRRAGVRVSKLTKKGGQKTISDF
ncbi:MAG: DNA polymerase IV [Candidatus Hydrothermarchaeaceae archaeon]